MKITKVEKRAVLLLMETNMKTMKKISYLLVVVLTLFLLSACVLEETPKEPTPTEVDPVAIFTSAAMTVEAELTQTALSFSPTPEPATATVPATATLVDLNATSVVNPKVTQPTGVVPTLGLGTPSLEPIATLALGTTPSGPICDDMEFVADITIPDGTTIIAGGDFEKIWRIRNTGVCTWDDGYQLALVSGGDTLDSKAVPHKIKTLVEPGQAVDVGANLTAPKAIGEYSSCYVMQNDRGYNFGTWICVTIKVKGD